MGEEKVVVSGAVPPELRDRLDELLMEGETRSSAVAKAVQTEVRLREHAMKQQSSDSKETAAQDEDVSHETRD